MAKKSSKKVENKSSLKEKFSKKFLKESFDKAWSGNEKLNNVFLWWGGIAYVLSFFILRPIINFIPQNITLNSIIDYILSLLIIFYFIFHIILIFKNKPKISKEGAQKIKEQEKKERGKRFVRKLFLKEPLTKWRPWLAFSAVNLLIIVHYIDLIA